MLKNTDSVGQVFNVFDQQEIDLILKILNTIKDSKVTNHAYANGFTKKDVVHKAIERVVCQKLESVLKHKVNVHLGMLLKEDNPWLIHTDYDKGDQDPALAYLIPLEIFPNASYKTSTIIFNEECTTTFAEFMKHSPKLERNARHIFDQHYSHGIKECLDYVSTQFIAEWQLGSVIYWDRKLLHTSDNFLKNGVTEKRALVLFCSKG